MTAYSDRYLKTLSCLAFVGLIIAHVSVRLSAVESDKPLRPNIVLILADDLGYGDLSCFGSKTIRTPHMDALAKQGTRFSQFYVSQAVCSASRASLMTGCYANRVGMEGALNHTSPQGINPNELLLPEMLKGQGYATAIFGKWHLGLSPYFSPLRNGFDEYLGIPYSNDNSKFHPTSASEMPPLPLYDGEKIVETNPDQSLFTQKFTERAVDFIQRNKDQPFFLYVPHVMPHVPIFASSEFKGHSPNGLYADVVEELDASVGTIVAAIERAGVRENTLIILSSDNGPFLSYGSNAGTTGGLREGKLTAYEGGVRVPCVMCWPGKIPAGSVFDEPLMTIDLLPTFANWLRASLSKNLLDGLDITDCLFGKPNAKSPHDHLLFYSGSELHAIRSGDWKLHLPHSYITVDGEPGRDGKPAGYGRLQPKSMNQSGVAGIASRHGYRVEQQALALYNLKDDPAESIDVSSKHSDVVKGLVRIAEEARQTIGDSISGTVGSEIRRCGSSAMQVMTAPFGTLPSGEQVQHFTLRNRFGSQIKVINYGATLTEISVPDRKGNFSNVILGSDTLESYVKGFPAASVIGRYANRIRNAKFTLDGKNFQVTKNSGENHIHGGRKNFAKSIWTVDTNRESTDSPADDASIRLSYVSVDGEEGFPGTVRVSVTYSLSDANELKIFYEAQTDSPTIVNLTNHAYFNLTGMKSDVLDHVLQIVATQYTIVDKSLIPTGEIASVEGTPLDFRTPRRIGDRIQELYESARGYDHNYVLFGDNGILRLAASITEPISGRKMECLTTEPGVQLYTANGFNNNPFPKHGAFCLETQHYPDSPNQPDFPSVVIRPGKPWNSTTVFRFSAN